VNIYFHKVHLQIQLKKTITLELVEVYIINNSFEVKSNHIQVNGNGLKSSIKLKIKKKINTLSYKKKKLSASSNNKNEE